MGDVTDYGTCPRCHERLTHPGGASRAVPERDIEVCGPCCTDEAYIEEHGGEVQKMAEWPVLRPDYGSDGLPIIPTPI